MAKCNWAELLQRIYDATMNVCEEHKTPEHLYSCFSIDDKKLIKNKKDFKMLLMLYGLRLVDFEVPSDRKLFNLTEWGVSYSNLKNM